MGREIRRVPKGWEHPRDESGEYRSMFDQTYEDAAAEWSDNISQWEAGTYPNKPDEGECRYFWDWHGMPPDKEYYRPAFDGPADCYQVYQTVSEGTPTSPVFETTEDLCEWLVREGYSVEVARSFVETGWAPSMLTIGGRLLPNIEACAELDAKAGGESHG